ncbi:MAG TPA: FKBP-type peptidyl-prolyl cis-trans isomerase [Sphingomicrobium sp.]|nr:FKBP-type peptidyl-prolyl cis-trans isomerase [Sphingomicrobium sp.]
MSASTRANPPRHATSLAKFWLGLLFLAAVGIAIAWIGAGSMRGETLPSGLAIRTIEQGSGAPIRMQDGVLVEYEGRLADGSVFETTAGRGPAPILVSQTIPGFTEALTNMREGGRYTITIPSELAYGDQPPPGLPPGADLEFDVHVVQVVPNAGAAAQQPPMQAPQPEPQP